MKKPGLTRRRFLRGLLGATGAAAAAASYGRWGESQWLQVNERAIPLDTPAPDGPIRVLHLSDLHAGAVVPLDYLSHAFDLGLALRPDAICVTGDFVTRSDSFPDDYADALRKLSAAAPTFASLGNHDGGAWTATHGGQASSAKVRATLAAAGISCLRNAAAPLTIRGRAIEVIGLGDLWSGECRPDPVFAALPRNRIPATRLVLSHNPDSKHLLQRHTWDLMLSGHTHGGQVGLPWLAARLAPVMDKRYIEGLHRWENRWLHVSRGVGCLFGMRFNCRPQATLLTIG